MQLLAVTVLLLLSSVSNGDVYSTHSATQTTVHPVDNGCGRSKPERSRKMTRRNAHDVDTFNVQGGFNITLAIERGIDFQTDFCSWKCNVNSSKGNEEIGSNCLSTILACTWCMCDSSCSEYGDCCGITHRHASNNNTDSATAATQPRYTCFLTEESTAVYIIASCAARTTTSVGGISQSNFTQTDTNTDSLPETDLLCNTCLSSPELIHLITSRTTGITYCNHHCLCCNEGRHANDADFVWRERSCNAEIDGIEDSPPNGEYTESTNVYCDTVFERPDTVITRQCDSKLHSTINNAIVNTCKPDLLGSRYNLSWDLVDQMEQLCQMYRSAVYTADAIYQNIFCYLCQGEIPMSCLTVELSDDTRTGFEFFVNLAALTQLSGDSPHIDLLDQEQPMHGHDLQHVSDVSCQKDYWKDNMKETCLPIVCAAGRALTNATSSEASCEMEASANDIYKLHVVVYIPTIDGHTSTQDFNSDSMNSKQVHCSKGICSNKHDHKCIHDTCLELDDVIRSQADLVSTSTMEFTALCEEVRNNYNIKDDLSSQVNITESNITVMLERSEQDVNLLPTIRDKAMPQLVHTSPDINRRRPSRSIRHRIARRVHANKKDSSMVYTRGLVNSVKPYIISALKTIRAADVLFQLHNVVSSKTQFQNDQTPGGPEEVTESWHCDSPSRTGVIMFLRLPPGTDRHVFESNILHHFNGMKDILIDTTAATVEMVLSSSEKVSLNPALPVYYFNSQNKACRVFTEPVQLAQLHSDALCSGGGCRVVPFNLLSSCPHVTLNISDFNISEDCELAKEGVTISKSQYIRQNETVDICTKVLRSLFTNSTDIHNKVPLLSRIESLLTLISLSMSLACLLLTFITYVTFPTLRSLPGKNNMVMVVCLYIAQLLLMLHNVPTKHSTACAVMGVLLHVSWLLTVLWTCACSFHMFHVFVIRRGVPSSRGSHTFYLTCYSITCCTVAAFIVVLVVSSKMYMSNYDNIGYGGHVCYLNTSLLVGVAFVLPLSVVLLFNLFFFSMTMYTISRIGDVKRHSGRERRNIHIYFRLSSLTGLCWILALLAEIPGLGPLRCFSVLVNGCQGITLFLAYVCNRRVSRMWRQLFKSKSSGFHKKPADSSKQATMSSSL